MTTRLGVILAVLCLTVATRADDAVKPAAKKGAKGPGMVTLTPSDLKWQDAPAPVSGVQRAVLKGDPGKGAHRSFIKFAGGTDNALHTHSSTLISVVLSGTFYEGADAATATDLPPGSYFETPGGWKHVSGCRPGAECVLYEESTGKFDFKPTGAAKPSGK